MGSRVFIAPEVLANVELEAELDRVSVGGAAAGVTGGVWSGTSPLYVDCLACGAYRGDPCHTRGGYCLPRISANRERLRALPTYAVPWKTPCCQREVWLVWRTSGDFLSWHGVPCFRCRKTYAMDLHATDAGVVSQRVLVDRIHPNQIEMTCWASTEANPWGS